MALLAVHVHSNGQRQIRQVVVRNVLGGCVKEVNEGDPEPLVLVLTMAPQRYNITGPGGGLGLWAKSPRPLKFKSTRPRGEMNAGLIILRVVSERRDAQIERDGVGLRRSFAAAAPSQQHYNPALNWSSHRRVPRGGAAGSTSRRDAAAPRGGTRAARSINSVAAASAPRRMSVTELVRAAASQQRLRRSSVTAALRAP